METEKAIPVRSSRVPSTVTDMQFTVSGRTVGILRIPIMMVFRMQTTPTPTVVAVSSLLLRMQLSKISL